jgi:signal transduction histidine kinase/ligand-binding sensor domain-containing protein
MSAPLVFALLALFCAAICPAIARAQYRFDHWTADNGLPQNIITAIQQTPDDYLWVATLDGLARFDGVRFTVFNKSNTTGLRSNRFYCLYLHTGGDLWAGTEVGVVTRYHQGRFITYSTEHGLPNSVVDGLIGDQQGRMWVLSGKKMLEWDPITERFRDGGNPPLGENIGALMWTQGGGYLTFDRSGVHLLAQGGWTHLPPSPEAVGRITLAAKADNGEVWIQSADGQILRLKDGRATSFLLGRRAAEEPARSSRPLTEWRDRSGKIWEFEIAPNLLRKLTVPSSGQAETITVKSIYEDRDGNLWLGTDGQGLYRIRKQLVATYSQEEGLVGRNIYPICEDRAGAIWAGAWNGGLSQIKAGKITNLTSRDGLGDGGVTALSVDRAGRLWVATHSDLQIFQQGEQGGQGRFTSVKANYLPSQATINVIYEDRAGAMWFGANEGLFFHQNGRTERLTGLPAENVRVVIAAASGGVWVGCYGGLMRWRDGKVASWTEADGLPGAAVRALYEDKDGALWIGAYDSGLARFKDGKFTSYTTREGLFNDGVFQILEDDGGNLWMSSNRGVYRVRKRDLNEFAAGERRDIASIPFGKSDGMRNVECNGGLWPAGVKSRDGRLWFPTQDGVVMIDPAAVTTNQQPPPVLIEEVLQDRAPIAWRDGVRLQPGQGNLEIQYTALAFANAAHLRFKYKLEGLDDDWVDAGLRRTAFFSYLPPGGYTFKVIAANSDGVWNLQGQSLRITVPPPFYRAGWFLTFAGLSIGGLVFAAFKYRLTQLERRQAAQQAFSRRLIESQEAERKRIAAELHDSLSQNLVIIKNRAMVSLQERDDPDQAFEQIEEIAEAADHALAEVREIAHNLRPYQIDRLGLTKAIEAIVKKANAGELQFTSNLDKIDSLLSPEAEINLYRMVQEAVNNILKHAQATNASIIIKRGEHAIDVGVRDNGRGFTLGAKYGSGLGLTGIAERGRLLGDAPRIESAPGQGTTISFKIRLNEAKR